MREIKFRGKKTSTGEWVYGSLITNPSGPHTIVQIRPNPVHNGIIQGWCFGVDRDSVGQFTGLHDKNGKQIYEGDIVEYYNNRHGEPIGSPGKGFIRYNSDCAIWQIAYKNTANKEVWDDINFKFLEVIGTIHENQELLTK